MLKTKDFVRDWTSRKWHKIHTWKAGTGKYIKRILNRKIRHKKVDIEE